MGLHPVMCLGFAKAVACGLAPPSGGLHAMHRLWLADPLVCLLFAWSVRPWHPYYKILF